MIRDILYFLHFWKYRGGGIEWKANFYNDSFPTKNEAKRILKKLRIGKVESLACICSGGGEWLYRFAKDTKATSFGIDFNDYLNKLVKIKLKHPKFFLASLIHSLQVWLTSPNHYAIESAEDEVQVAILQNKIYLVIRHLKNILDAIQEGRNYRNMVKDFLSLIDEILNELVTYSKYREFYKKFKEDVEENYKIPEIITATAPFPYKEKVIEYPIRHVDLAIFYEVEHTVTLGKLGKYVAEKTSKFADYAIIIPYHEGDALFKKRTSDFIGSFRKFGKIEREVIEIKCYYTSYRHIWSIKRLSCRDPTKPQFFEEAFDKKTNSFKDRFTIYKVTF